jgi:putative hydrolase of the HAD superfamily
LADSFGKHKRYWSEIGDPTLTRSELKMADCSNIRGVTFDVGGTLISPWPSVGHIYGEIAHRHGYVKIPPAVLNERFAAAWKNKHGFSHTRQQWQRLVNETFAGLLPAPPSHEFFADLYAWFGKATAWRVFDDVHPTLKDLHERGIRLGVVSNWDERLRPLMKELELSPYFAACAISIEVGAAKPSQGIFQAAASALDLPPTSLLHVGDTMNEDIDGAHAAGFSALLLDREAARTGVSALQEGRTGVSALRDVATPFDGAIRSLAEIPELLEKRL